MRLGGWPFQQTRRVSAGSRGDVGGSGEWWGRDSTRPLPDESHREPKKIGESRSGRRERKGNRGGTQAHRSTATGKFPKHPPVVP
uniref:Uncharacterized protein n=1 Tax=Human herpesvirus 1 TaxID=10298 RepID=A0A2Z4GZV9_HHV1|nr:hypothetical protein [Human alphaherpesvirus 1]